MNFVIYFVLTLSLPLLISGQTYYDLGQKLLTHRGFSVETASHHDFTSKLGHCIWRVSKSPDFIQCLEDESQLLKGISSPSDPKISCCTRVMNFKCMRKFLTSQCHVSREEVERNSEQHYNFWNEFDVDGYSTRCSQTSHEAAIRYCSSGVSKVTWNITLYLAVFALYFLVFGKF